MRDSLLAFKEQLRQEHEGRMASLRREVEEKIADLIAERRTQTEREVTRWRRKCQAERDQHEQVLRHRALGHYRRCGLEVVRNLVASVEEHVDRRFRSLDAEERRRLLTLLAQEALSRMEGAAVLAVSPGDENVVEGLPGVVRVEGVLEDPWGGCVSRDAANGRHVVDNTFRTRWSRSEGFLAAQLGVALGGQEDDIERFARELRIY